MKQYGIKQIAQRSAGFDTYDLDLATKYDIIISNVPSYSPSSIAEFAVTQAINIVRYQNVFNIKCIIMTFVGNLLYYRNLSEI